jgi:hypothetical protein
MAQRPSQDFRVASLRRFMPALLIALGIVGVGTSVAAGEPVRIPVVLHIAQDEGTPVVDQTFLAGQLAFANQTFLPLGFQLVVHERFLLPPGYAELNTRADRDTLASVVRRGALHWFVVRKLMDVDEPGRERRGVHWHERDPIRRHFVIVSKIAGPYVLAHELGHFFGNPKHSEVPGNLMSYQRTERPPTLDAEQSANVTRTLARMLRSRELVPIGASAQVRSPKGK